MELDSINEGGTRESRARSSVQRISKADPRQEGGASDDGVSWIITYRGRIISTNELLSQYHRQFRRTINVVKTYAGYEIKPRKITDGAYRVICLANSRHDIDNLQPTIKAIIDIAVKKGLVKGDTPRYMKEITTRVDKTLEKNTLKIGIQCLD